MIADPDDVQVETVTEAELERQADELRQASAVFENIRESVASRVVGQNAMMERLLVGLLTGGQLDLGSLGPFFQALQGQRVIAQVETLVLLEFLD